MSSQLGSFGAALLIFASGFFAMRSSDWKVIGGFTLLALVGGVIAAAFARRP